MRIAFFGGSFDPPHLGHLAIAEAARQTLSLDRILFAPVGLQPLKSQGSSASFEDRVAMTRLAIQYHPSFELSLADAPIPGNPEPNYTIDTLAQLHKFLPADTELFLLLGADALRTLHHWRRAAEIPFAANLIIASRPEAPSALSSLTNPVELMPIGVHIAPFSGSSGRYRLSNAAGAVSELTVLPGLDYDISATELRRQIHAGPDSTAASLLPPGVLDYIRSHNLYR
jgi:nicotinate-nucleotide adenylyltransferase